MVSQRQPVKTCDECESFFFPDASQMLGLCPECAHLLYGYENCDRIFVNGRCSVCYWDGSTSDYIESLKANKVS